jgi:hypothetical protein
MEEAADCEPIVLSLGCKFTERFRGDTPDSYIPRVAGTVVDAIKSTGARPYFDVEKIPKSKAAIEFLRPLVDQAKTLKPARRTDTVTSSILIRGKMGLPDRKKTIVNDFNAFLA